MTLRPHVGDLTIGINRETQQRGGYLIVRRGESGAPGIRLRGRYEIRPVTVQVGSVGLQLASSPSNLIRTEPAARRIHSETTRAPFVTGLSTESVQISPTVESRLRESWARERNDVTVLVGSVTPASPEPRQLECRGFKSSWVHSVDVAVTTDFPANGDIALFRSFSRKADGTQTA